MTVADLRAEVTTARDKLAAAVGYLTHSLKGSMATDEAIDAADRMLDVVAGHLTAAKAHLSTEGTNEHGG